MDKNLLVEIFVRKKGGGGWIGTGYPVWSNRILTARHILFPPEGAAELIEVRWHHLEGAAREWHRINQIVWEGGNDGPDVAVIDCTFPEGAQQFFQVANSKPVEHWRWESEGFPNVGARDDDTRKPIGIHGSVYGAADSAEMFGLGVEDATDLPDGWRGISGAPVFVSGLLLGVIVDCPKGFDQTRLWAIPTWRLLQKQVFCKEVGVDAKRVQDRQHAIECAIEKLLAKAPQAAEVLSSAFKCDKKSLAQRLVSEAVPGSKIPEGILDNFVELKRRREDAAAKVLYDIALEIAPCVIDASLVEQVRSSKGKAAVSPLALPMATHAAVEAVYAAADSRAAKFKDDSYKSGDLMGVFSLPLPPVQNGFQNPETQFANDIKHHLFKERHPGLKPTEENIPVLADRLCTFSKFETFYFVIDMPTDLDSLKQIECCIMHVDERLRRWVGFVAKSGSDNKQRLREQEQFDGLYYMMRELNE